jgi:hypothetical protein
LEEDAHNRFQQLVDEFKPTAFQYDFCIAINNGTVTGRINSTSKYSTTVSRHTEQLALPQITMFCQI